jgi:hypothetical protein
MISVGDTVYKLAERGCCLTGLMVRQQHSVVSETLANFGHVSIKVFLLDSGEVVNENQITKDDSVFYFVPR